MLAVLLGVQPATTDLYLPTLPALRADLGASVAAAQMTLGVLVLSFGIAQLVIGPLSDRLGRRPVLLSGLMLYIAASLASAGAPHIDALVLCRAVQGVGLACSVVCARAVLRDLFEPQEGAQVMARALGGVGFVALVGPLAGAAVADAWNWRAAFVLCSLFAAAALALVAWKLPESLAPRHRQPLRPGPMLHSLRRIATHPAFLAWSALMAGTYGAIYTYLAGSAFVFIETLGRSRLAYSLVLATATGSYMAGTFACRRRLQRSGLLDAVRRGAAFSALGGTAMLVIALLDWREPAAIATAMAAIAFGHGYHQPCAQAAVTGPFPAQAGMAAALAGFVMSLVAFGISAWLGWAANGTMLPVLGTQAVFALATALIAATLIQQLGHRLAPVAVARPAA